MYHFPDAGFVTLRMTAVTIQMSMKTFAKARIVPVLRVRCAVTMASAFQCTGDVTTMMTVGTEVTKLTVVTSSARYKLKILHGTLLYLRILRSSIIHM